MKRVKVLVPFTDKVTGEVYNADAEILLSDERIAEIKAVNVNMIEVVGEVEEAAAEPEAPVKKPRARKPKTE